MKRTTSKPAIMVIVLLYVLPFAIGIFSAWLADANPENSAIDDRGGYASYLSDEAGMLDEAEEAAILEKMSEFSGLCNVFVVTGESTSPSTVPGYYDGYLSRDTGAMYLFIESDLKKASIFTSGSLAGTVDDSRKTEILDNVRPYMDRGDYAGCLEEGLEELHAIAVGESVFAPMRYINNAFLALALSAILMFLFVSRSRDKTRDIGYSGNMQSYIRQTSYVEFPNPRFPNRSSISDFLKGTDGKY